MADRRESAARSPGAADRAQPPDQAAERERVLLLECRLEQMRAALESARREADATRMKLAEAAAREADEARRHAALATELADARSEIAMLHAHLERSHALRAEMQGHFFEGGPTGDAEELVRLRRATLASEQKAVVLERALGRLYQRVEELLGSRETLLTRFAEWQQLVRVDGPEAADLSEFVAELRREILDLEHHGIASEAREAKLRERLALAGVDPSELLEEASAVSARQVADTQEEEEAVAGVDVPGVEPAEDSPLVRASAIALDQPRPGGAAEAPEGGVGPAPPANERERERPDGTPPTDRVAALIEELERAETAALEVALLLRLGRSADERAVKAVELYALAPAHEVRAAAYEALGRLLEHDGHGLEAHLRRGLEDTDARVRRRVALATAAARDLDRRALLETLAEDPDAQVRRVVQQVLRHAPASAERSGARPPRSVRAYS